MSISLGVVFYCWEWAISRSIAVFFFFFGYTSFFGSSDFNMGSGTYVGGVRFDRFTSSFYMVRGPQDIVLHGD